MGVDTASTNFSASSIRVVIDVGGTGKELAEAAASVGASLTTKELLNNLANMDNDKVKEFLRSAGFDETTVMLIAAAAGYGGKWALRLVIRLHSDPEARAKLVRIGRGTLKAIGKAFGPDRRMGSTGLDWVTFPETE